MIKKIKKIITIGLVLTSFFVAFQTFFVFSNDAYAKLQYIDGNGNAVDAPKSSNKKKKDNKKNNSGSNSAPAPAPAPAPANSGSTSGSSSSSNSGSSSSSSSDGDAGENKENEDEKEPIDNTPEEVKTAILPESWKIEDILNMILLVVTTGVGIAAVGAIVYAGVLYITARDNAGQVSKAKTMIMNTVIGVVAYILMWAFLQWIIPGGVF
ncbi:MAG: hypothetical protein HXK95_000055 [Candidatus Nanogingivalaceae bacterium]|jgi:hypothetical protein|nr:hypothetical protein [Candidatus Nanogingivalaceae bacterium]QTI96297.1 MAG: hypothetical protein HXK94_000055 [Candidatus Nanogingivalaceae bacterium]QWB91608.1 MAG: hypothetical protein HXK95_000055 [Candidatus Nanogingivalaceae bacterium]